MEVQFFLGGRGRWKIKVWEGGVAEEKGVGGVGEGGETEEKG